MDPIDPADLRDPTGAPSRRRLFRRRKIPVRLLVPNFFTLLSLCAGITAMRMAIEKQFEWALALIVFAALLDGVDGRLARALKSQSRFGAEFDSLADFVNFGVAPAILVYTWGLGDFKRFGWIAVLLFACGMALRLARFNSMLDVDKPRWQSNYFTGIPAPAGALTVLLPLYLEGLGIPGFDPKAYPAVITVYTLALAFMLVSTIPTFSGKLLGERIPRELVMPILFGVVLVVALLVTYPYVTLAIITLGYLALIPFGYVKFQKEYAAWKAATASAPASEPLSGTNVVTLSPPSQSDMKH
ncbi:MAG TPA: CDP-diacylglycerol--serine O-phosphatidyltransferase [Hyphomicrobiaceae bacterium]|nr:CDP-diacylglycerol--serine O-phosphatidyltransferase [Hyphomicrobiaceae bacterium]